MRHLQKTVGTAPIPVAVCGSKSRQTSVPTSGVHTVVTRCASIVVERDTKEWTGAPKTEDCKPLRPRQSWKGGEAAAIVERSSSATVAAAISLAHAKRSSAIYVGRVGVPAPALKRMREDARKDCESAEKPHGVRSMNGI